LTGAVAPRFLGDRLPFVALGELPPPEVRTRVAPLRAINSSVVVSSRALLRESEGFARYTAHLSPKARDELEALPAGVWVPVALARVHFEACDAVGLSELARVDIGRRIAVRLHGPLFRLAMRLAGAAGMTPVQLAARSIRLWPERNQGGDLLIVHATPTEARAELLGYGLADIPFVRLLWRGTFEAHARLVMPTVRVAEVSSACTRTSLVYSIAWGRT
jgi:hypothetical protein